MNTQDWSPLGWTSLILQIKELSRVFSNTTVLKASILRHSAFFIVQLLYPYMTTGKIIALVRWTCVGKVMSLLFNMLSIFVIVFLPMSKHLFISWLQSPSEVILEPKKINSLTVSIYLPWSNGTGCHDLGFFWILSFKPAFSLSSFTLIKSFFSSLSAIRMVSLVYLRLLIFLPAILIPACVSSSPALRMMYSAYKLNKQGDSIQPWLTPFPIWNQSVVPCPVLTVAFWHAYKFLRRQGRWSGISISLRIFQFVVIHTVKGFGVVNRDEVDIFLELSCFFDDPVDVGYLISGSSAFSKSNLNIWKFSVRVLLKPGLEDFEQYFSSLWDECNCVVVWTFFDIVFLWNWNENWPFPDLWPLRHWPHLFRLGYASHHTTHH